MTRFGLLLGGVSIAAAGVVVYHAVLSGDPPESDARFSGGGFDGAAQTQYLQSPVVPYTPPPRFSGGSYDGEAHSDMLVNEVIPYVSPKRFSGGPADGHDAVDLGVLNEPRPMPPVRFSGGGWDGFSVQVVADNLSGQDPGADRFYGGGFDGFAYAASLRSDDEGFASRRFSGGAFDGHVEALYYASGGNGVLYSPRYFGGGGDGYGSVTCRIASVLIILDSDMDGLPDWWEQQYFGGATNATANALSDESGLSNYEKYIAGLEPHNSSAVLVFTPVDEVVHQVDGANVSLTWDTKPGRIYRIFASDNPWDLLAGDPVYEIIGTGQKVTYVHPAESHDSRMFMLTVELLSP